MTGQRVFDLIQESLNNVQKHAQAHVVQIKLEWYISQLDVAVSDDGVGFEVAAASGPGHYGLTMLRERVQDLHGEMRINSTPGAGTSLRFEIPLRSP
jgi:signal transduction histidine kinase